MLQSNPSHQAILAPFATKSIPKKDLPTDANANCLELEIDNLKDNDVVNEDNNPSQDLNNNDKLDKEVAVDVARSNAMDVNFAAEEADLDGHLDPLPQAVRAASALSITKVSAPFLGPSFPFCLLTIFL